MVQGGRNRPTQIVDVDTQRHFKRLSQHVRASLSVPAIGEERLLLADVFSDSGSDVTAISEALLEKLQAEEPEV